VEVDIEKCVLSGGIDCNAVKGIAVLYGNEIKTKDWKVSARITADVRIYRL